MSTIYRIYRYTIEDEEGNEQPYVWEQHEYKDADEAAQEIHGRLIEYEYEYADSSMVADYTDSDA